MKKIFTTLIAVSLASLCQQTLAQSSSFDQTMVIDVYGDSTIWGSYLGTQPIENFPNQLKLKLNASALFKSATGASTIVVNNEGRPSTELAALYFGFDSCAPDPKCVGGLASHPEWTLQLAKTNANVVMVEGGLNEVANGTATSLFSSTLKSVINKARKMGKFVIAQTSNKTINWVLSYNRASEVDAMAAAMRTTTALFQKTNDGYTSANAALFDVNSYLDINTLAYIPDLHPTAAFYNSIAGKFDGELSLRNSIKEYRAQLDIVRIFAAATNRQPDFSELNLYTNYLKNGTYNLQQVNALIFQLPSATALFPSSMTNSDFVNKFYVTVLGRTADKAGYDYWIAQLASGTSRATLIFNLVYATVNYQGGDPAGIGSKLLFNKKTAVGWYSSAVLRNSGGSSLYPTMTQNSDVYNLNNNLAGGDSVFK